MKSLVLLVIGILVFAEAESLPGPDFDPNKYYPLLCERPAYETPDVISSRHALTPDVDPFIGTGGDGYGYVKTR